MIKIKKKINKIYFYKSIEITKNVFILNSLKNNINKIITGLITKIKKTLFTIYIKNNISCIIKKEDLLYNDNYKVNDLIKACLKEIKYIKNKFKLYLSRCSNLMLESLLILEIPEIKENLVKIKKIVRIPGFESKISVIKNNDKINLIKVCIGVNGVKIKKISKELNNEKINILFWHTNLIQYITNLFYPIKIKLIKNNKKNIIIFLNKKLYKTSIGKNGNNIKLINKFIKYKLKIEEYND